MRVVRPYRRTAAETPLLRALATARWRSLLGRSSGGPGLLSGLVRRRINGKRPAAKLFGPR